MNIEIIPFILTGIIGGVVYQVSLKLLPQDNINPFTLLAYVYLSSFIMCVFFAFFQRNNYEYNLNVGGYSFSVIVLSLATIFIEASYLFAFKAGAKLSSFSIIVLISVIVIIYLSGVLFFDEKYSLKSIMGLFLCLFGLYLVKS